MLHNTLHKLLNDPDTAFVVVGAAITIFILLLKWLPNYCVILWKSTLISYIIFIIFMLLGQVYQHSSFAEIPLFGVPYRTFGAILVVPGMLIYGLIPGAINMCPSDFDEFGTLTCAFLFYAIVLWGVMKAIKINKEVNAAGKKQDDNM